MSLHITAIVTPSMLSAAQDKPDNKILKVQNRAAIGLLDVFYHGVSAEHLLMAVSERLDHFSVAKEGDHWVVGDGEGY